MNDGCSAQSRTCFRLPQYITRTFLNLQVPGTLTRLFPCQGNACEQSLTLGRSKRLCGGVGDLLLSSGRSRVFTPPFTPLGLSREVHLFVVRCELFQWNCRKKEPAVFLRMKPHGLKAEIDGILGS